MSRSTLGPALIFLAAALASALIGVGAFDGDMADNEAAVLLTVLFLALAAVSLGVGWLLYRWATSRRVAAWSRIPSRL